METFVSVGVPQHTHIYNVLSWECINDFIAMPSLIKTGMSQ